MAFKNSKNALQEKPVADFIPCAHEQCDHTAILRIHSENSTDKPLINVCRSHYEFHISQGAKRYCEARGLRSVQQKRDYIRKMLPSIGKGQGNLEWAYKLKAREEAGEALLPIQRTLWREALQNVHMAEREPGEDDEVATA